MNAERWKVAVVMVLAVLALAAGEAFIARGMRQAGRVAGSAGWWVGVRAAATNGWAVAGVTLLGLHLGLYATALAIADLSLVMPLTAASYPLGALLARYFLHEPVGPSRWIGTAIIAAGVTVVIWGERQNPA